MSIGERQVADIACFCCKNRGIFARFSDVGGVKSELFPFMRPLKRGTRIVTKPNVLNEKMRDFSIKIVDITPKTP